MPTSKERPVQWDYKRALLTPRGRRTAHLPKTGAEARLLGDTGREPLELQDRPHPALAGRSVARGAAP